MKKLIKWFNQKTGYRYYYSVIFKYSDKNKRVSFDWSATVGLVNKNIILTPRDVKKIGLPLHKASGIPKHLLKNGNLRVDVICYIGYMKQ